MLTYYYRFPRNTDSRYRPYHLAWSVPQYKVWPIRIPTSEDTNKCKYHMYRANRGYYYKSDTYTTKCKYDRIKQDNTA